MSETQSPRRAAHNIDRQFVDRWSPRAFTGEAVPQEVLMRLFEAARWAPSSYNSQPWRFVYARRGTQHWDAFVSLLNPFNQSWAQNAGALIIIVSKKTFVPPGGDKATDAYSHSFDAGAAWQNLALQASNAGWAAHAMVGFDFEKTTALLGIPSDCRIEAAVAIGRRGDPSVLPEALRAREMPNDRLPVEKLASEGKFDTSQLLT